MLHEDLLDLRGEGTAVHERVELEVQPEAADVHVRAPHAGDHAVHHDRLRVQHAFVELVDDHAGFEELFVEALAGPLHQQMVGAPWQHDAHVHAAQCRERQRACERGIGDEIRCEDVEPLARRLDERQRLAVEPEQRIVGSARNHLNEVGAHERRLREIRQLGEALGVREMPVAGEHGL